VQAQFEREGLRVDHDTAERLVELVGEDAFALQNEVEKLAAWGAGAPVGAREVEALAAPAHEASSFAVGDAWGARDVAAALAACETRLLQGEEPSVLAWRFADHVSRVRAVQRLLEDGLSVREVAARLGLKDYPARKQAGHARNYSREELSAALVRLAELDVALKGGSKLDAALELERALVDVTRPA
jgi:DNA polymerase-3 subunit delta